METSGVGDAIAGGADALVALDEADCLALGEHCGKARILEMKRRAIRGVPFVVLVAKEVDVRVRGYGVRSQ